MINLPKDVIRESDEESQKRMNQEVWALSL